MSHQKYRWVDKIIDLAIALEAALAGKQSSGVTYRLQVRAGAFLASDADPAGALFDDIKVLYGITTVVERSSGVPFGVGPGGLCHATEA